MKFLLGPGLLFRCELAVSFDAISHQFWSKILQSRDDDQHILGSGKTKKVTSNPNSEVDSINLLRPWTSINPTQPTDPATNQPNPTQPPQTYKMSTKNPTLLWKTPWWGRCCWYKKPNQQKNNNPTLTKALMLFILNPTPTPTPTQPLHDTTCPDLLPAHDDFLWPQPRPNPSLRHHCPIQVWCLRWTGSHCLRTRWPLEIAEQGSSQWM